MKCKRPRCQNVRYSTSDFCKTHAKALGFYHPLASGDEAREIITKARESGWSLTAIARETSLNLAGLRRILNSTHQDVQQSTLDALRAIDTSTPRPMNKPAWPACRRVRSLCAIGVSFRQIARMTGLNKSAVARLARGIRDEVHADTAQKIDAVWDELHMSPAGEPTAWAKQQDWVPPAWWDDIDNPEEQPGVTHCIGCHRDRARLNREGIAKGRCSSCANARYLMIRKSKAKHTKAVPHAA